MKTFKATLKDKINNVYGLHLLVPIEIVDYYKKKNINRFNIKFNDSKAYPRAILSNGNDQYYLYLNKALQKEMKARLGDEIFVQMQPDTSDYGMPMPEELAECLYQMPVGNDLFHKLTPGKQRSLIYMVAKPKREETRVKKAYQILSYLESVNGKLDYKELNVYFKENNF